MAKELREIPIFVDIQFLKYLKVISFLKRLSSLLDLSNHWNTPFKLKL